MAKYEKSIVTFRMEVKALDHLGLFKGDVTLSTDQLMLFCLFFVMQQKVPSELELLPEEYSVMIGSYPCNISFHNDQLFHCTISGQLSSSESELPVTVSSTNTNNPYQGFTQQPSYLISSSILLLDRP